MTRCIQRASVSIVVVLSTMAAARLHGQTSVDVPQHQHSASPQGTPVTLESLIREAFDKKFEFHDS